MKFKTIIGAGIVAGSIAISSLAGASITIDSEGNGFVGKGDVQYSFGWNNAQLQSRAGNVAFGVQQTQKVYQDCEKVQRTGPPSNPTYITIDQTQQRNRQLSATLDGDPRQTKGQKQFTGFIMKGFVGEADWSGQTPTCPGDFEPIGDLYFGDVNGAYTVSWDGNTVPLVEKPVV